MEIIDNNRIVLDLYLYHQLTTDITMQQRDLERKEERIRLMEREIADKDKIINEFLEVIKGGKE